MASGPLREATLRVRLRPWVKAELRRESEERQLTISEIVRAAVMRELGHDPAAGPPKDWRENVRTRAAE